jgi:hypothetical protein
VANLVYSATGSSVETVFVDGRVVVDGGRVLTLDEDEIYQAVHRLMPGILDKTGLRDVIAPRWPIES